MICFPNAKINLGLHIRNLREDGFHNIESLMIPVGWNDVLEIMPSKSTKNTLKVYGDRNIAANDDNLCIKAAVLMQENYQLPPVDIYLFKNIPCGAGLGGGSSDAAFTLKLINELLSLDLNKKTLFELAMQLGSDCGFFISNEIAKVGGRGEVLEILDVEPPKLKLMIAVPSSGISTASAYSAMKGRYNDQPVDVEAFTTPASWQSSFRNDFESIAFNEIPQILSIRDKMLQSGAIYASMSGSGSSVFGVFPYETVDFPVFKDCRTWTGDFF